MRKRILAWLFTFVVASILMVPALATTMDGTANGGISMLTMEAEETQIVYRTINGQLQYRVWSLTYGYWKTDWINI